MQSGTIGSVSPFLGSFSVLFFKSYPRYPTAPLWKGIGDGFLANLKFLTMELRSEKKLSDVILIFEPSVISTLASCAFITRNGSAPAKEYLPRPQLSSKNEYGRGYILRKKSTGFMLHGSMSMGNRLASKCQSVKAKEIFDLRFMIACQTRRLS